MDALPSRPNAADLYGPESIQDFTLEQYSGLFGLEVKLPLPKCYRYSGPQMQDITMEQDGDIVLRKYIFTDPIIFSAFVPGFQGTKFEEFSLKCLVISEQVCTLLIKPNSAEKESDPVTFRTSDLMPFVVRLDGTSTPISS